MVRFIETKRKFKKSFYEWCIENNRQDILELWDYELNSCKPNDVSYGSGKKCYFKCPRELHPSKAKQLMVLTRDNTLMCDQCNSFGQWLIDEYGEDALEKYWDYEKNKVDPFKTAKCSKTKVWINCLEKEYHGSYEISCANYYKGRRCPYCGNRHDKVHPKDSFAQYHIDNTDPDFLEKYWSKRNTVDPFALSIASHKKIWMICQNDKEHKNYEISCANFTKGKRCGNCRESYGERNIAKWLDGKNVKYIREKTFSDLLGIGNECLRYDFYLPELNLFIEYQGQYHDGTARYSKETQEEYDKRVNRQQEHDRRKREYAKLHNIKLLEIWYWDYDNIEKILSKNIK